MSAAPGQAPLRVGATIPELAREPTEAQLFAFSAATWNAHRIHYDGDYAREREGYPGVLVQSHLHACFLGQTVAAAFGPGARITRLGWQNRALAVPGDRLVVAGTVAAVERVGSSTRVELDLVERNQRDEVCVTGWATVEIEEEAES